MQTGTSPTKSGGDGGKEVLSPGATAAITIGGAVVAVAALYVAWRQLRASGGKLCCW